MNNATEMPDVDPRVTTNAVSVYGQDDALDDFPVLKAFQHYIDAEQSKARKRMLSLCIFFGCLMTCVITVFVFLVLNVTSRNQELNDRLIDFAMNRERSQPASGSPVVVQPPQDSAAILALTAKLDGLQKKLADDQEKAEKAAKEAAEKARLAAIEAATPKGPTAEELEILKLKALLASEKKKNSIEKELKRKAEIEAYRRKYYPELYAESTPKAPSRPSAAKRRTLKDEEADVDAEIEDIIGEETAISYFDEEEDVVASEKAQRKGPVRSKASPSPSEPEKEYSIPVDIKGSSIRWQIPND